MLQSAPQEWADALKIGFLEGLESEGLTQGDSVLIVFKSAGGEASSLTTVARLLLRGSWSAIYALGTQASQEVFSAMADTGGIPLVFGAVTDPIEAGFYDGALDRPRKNLTGSQDIWPYGEQFRVFRELLPRAQRIGILYNPAEANTKAALSLVRSAASATNFTLDERVVATVQEIDIALAALLKAKVHAIYLPPDNTVQSRSATIIAQAGRAKVPVFTGITGIVAGGAIATVGTNYVAVGRENGIQVAKILRGQAPRTMPPAVASSGDLHINVTQAKRIGIVVPQSLVDRAVRIY